MKSGTPDSEPYWAGLAGQRLVLPFCRACGRGHFPPMPSCPECGRGDGFDQRAVSGLGRVYTWTVAHYAFWPEFAADVPYIIAVVTLDEGPRVYGRIIDVPVDADLAGQRVRVVFQDLHGTPVASFAPAEDRDGAQRCQR